VLGAAALLVCGSALGMADGGARRADREPRVIEVKMGIDSLSAVDQGKLWQRLDDYAKADSLLEFCGRKMNLYRRTWNAVSPCVETSALKKVGGIFISKKKRYLEILGGNYPDEEKKKALCDGMAPQLKTYVSILEQHITEASGMCSACLWC
jgi:hypothetical protein